jgi:hypothetical protein
VKDAELSYAEVQRLGAVSWHPVGYLYVDGRLLRIAAESSDCRSISVKLVRTSSLHGDEKLIQTGWHHLEGCECEHCRAG